MLTEAEVANRIKATPVRCKFDTLYAAKYWANQFGGCIAHNEETGQIFWYSWACTTGEIMADLPPHEEHPNWKGFTFV